MRGRVGILGAALFAGACLVAPRAAVAELVFRRPLERVASMDPLRSASVCEARAVALVYESPLEVDYFARPYRLKGSLCDLPEVSTNGLVYTFRIRAGARFQPDACFPRGEGRPVVAEDVVYSLNRLGDKKNASSGLWTMDGVARVEAVDARTVRITLKKPLHVFPWLMAMAYAAVVPHEAVEMYGARFGGVAVGSGPYRLHEWWRNHRMRFRRDPTWRGWREIRTKPYDELDYLVVDDVSTQWLMFLSGQVDFLGEVSHDNWDAVVAPDGTLAGDLEQRGVRLHGAPTMTVMYVGVNMRDPLLGANRKLRQALNCAFDAPAWKRFLNNRVEPSDGPVPPGVAGRLETPFAYAFDVEKAKRLVAEAGYPGGVDPRTGKRLEIPITIGRANQSAREEVELMQSFYNRVGIRLEPRYMTWNAYLDAVDRGDVTLFMLAWIGDYPDAENFLQLFHSKNVSPGANHGNYCNPAFDALYDKAMATADADERARLWQAAQEIIREDCPWIFLHFPKAYSLSWDHLGNYIPTDFPYGTEKHLFRK
ncbi:MAG: ABC transporter substrate-binding protein [Kiritimatiellia bacterium]